MKREVILNNIQFDNVLFTKTGENVLFSPSIKEEFFGIYTVDLFNESVLCEQYKNNYVNCTVKINGHLFENVIFRLVESDVYRIVINENLIDEPFSVQEKAWSLDEKDLIIENLKLEVERLRRDKQVLKKKAVVAEKVVDVAAELKPYKEDILKEFVNFTNEQKEILSENFETIHNKLINVLENKFVIRQREITETAIQEATDRMVNLSKILQEKVLSEALKASEEVFNEKYATLENTLLNVINESVNNQKKEFYKELNIIVERVNKNQERYVEILEESNGKKKLITETDKQLEKLNKRLDDYGGKINALLNEKRNLQQIVETNKQYTDIKFDQVLEESRRYSRVVLDMAGGGSGSVAQQFAAGGTISGSLTIGGSLSAQNDNIDGGTA